MKPTKGYNKNMPPGTYERTEETRKKLSKASLGKKHTDETKIDYNKKNLDPKNLISLCKNCHSKTNTDREYWSRYLCAP